MGSENVSEGEQACREACRENCGENCKENCRRACREAEGNVSSEDISKGECACKIAEEIWAVKMSARLNEVAKYDFYESYCYDYY